MGKDGDSNVGRAGDHYVAGNLLASTPQDIFKAIYLGPFSPKRVIGLRLKGFLVV